MCHLAGPTRDVELAGHHESVAGAPHRCGFDEARASTWREIRERRGIALLAYLVCERASF